jgi:hypothetical protein
LEVVLLVMRKYWICDRIPFGCNRMVIHLSIKECSTHTVAF